jgi:hypothetical protein
VGLLEWIEQERQMLPYRDHLQNRAIDGGEGRRSRPIRRQNL